MKPIIVFLSILPIAPWLASCSDDDNAAPDAGIGDARFQDAHNTWDDGGPVDAAPWDGAVPDASHPRSHCEEVLVTDQVFDLDPDGPDTQIHATATFDGTAMWVGYSRPDAHRDFDIYALRLGCDGIAETAPFQVNTTDFNDVDPALAISQGRVFIVWQTDTGSATANMQTLFRAYTWDASPLTGTDAMLRTEYLGQPVMGNTWMPAVAGLPDGFVLAGSRALPDATGLQVYLQKFSAAGAVEAATIDASFQPEAGQMYPAVAAAPDGTIYLAYQQALPPDFEDQVVSTRFLPGRDVADLLPPPPPDGRTQSKSPSLAAAPDGTVFLAFADSLSGRVVLTLAADPAAPQVELGARGRTSFAPVLALGPDGTGVVAYYQNVSGLRNEFWAVGFSWDGTAFHMGQPTQVTTEQVPPYQPAAAHVFGNVYFFSWAKGTSPDFRLQGVFLHVPMP